MQSLRLLLALSPGASLAPVTPITRGRRVKARWVVVLLAVGVCLDLLISVAIVHIANQARNAASSIHIARVATYEFCLANNDAKLADLQRWHEIVTLLRHGKDTPSLRTFIAGVERANGAADAPRDCSRLVP